MTNGNRITCIQWLQELHRHPAVAKRFEMRFQVWGDITKKTMKLKKKSVDELRSEYDFDYFEAIQGKYYRRLLEKGSNVIVLDQNVAKAFHDSASVNEALRSLLNLTETTKRLTKRSVGRVKTHRTS